MPKKKTPQNRRNPDMLLTILYVLAIVVLYLLFKPFISALVVGGIIIILLYPLNKKLQKKIKNKTLSSTIMLVLVIIIILIPAYFLFSNLAIESGKAYTSFSKLNITQITQSINDVTGLNLEIHTTINKLTTKALEYLENSALSILGSVTEVLLSLFIMFFFIFYGFKDGEKIQDAIINILPVKKEHKNHVLTETKKVLNGVMYGQMLVSLLQGFLGGLGFWIFGIPNPILWGFIMAIFAFIPFLGTPMIWLPAAIIAFLSGNVVGGIGMLIFGAIIVAQIDNVIKPKIIGDSSGMHPVLVLLGIFGGLALFGLIGFILGPLVVAISILLIRFFTEEMKD
ncbi:AI-2E family transporter [Candidatus Woesearchaeota archaeon]|nr:AI-2E family transporter [Candidatus Woesearchaeota archaeon]MCF7901124.1 AI-2E family transporter [Candidatus Woesearchaeota archaeon]MCF8012887.1 AI-2E family transporter [Candidatus Woesearchaeota archaeon]